MNWSELGRNQGVLAIAGAIVVLALVVAGAYAVSRATRYSGDAVPEATATPGATATVRAAVSAYRLRLRTPCAEPLRAPCLSLASTSSAVLDSISDLSFTT